MLVLDKLEMGVVFLPNLNWFFIQADLGVALGVSGAGVLMIKWVFRYIYFAV